MEKQFDIDPTVHLAVVMARLDQANAESAMWEAVARTTKTKLEAVTAELIRAIGSRETVTDAAGTVPSD